MNNYEGLQLTFIPFDFGEGKCKGRITGMTISVYDNHAAISSQLHEALGNPEKISVGFLKEFEAVYIKADPNGIALSTKRGRNQFGSSYMRKNIKKYYPYDSDKYFLRLTDGQKFGEYYLFPLREIEKIQKRIGD